MQITMLMHPYYLLNEFEYAKWRLTQIGGRPFIHRYLHKFDAREDDDDFKRRRDMSYCPAFAMQGLTEIKNGIYQRMSEITRSGGSQTYRDAAEGKEGGVDLEGNNMNSFIGQQILPEMMVMGKVGVWVDMPNFDSQSTLAAYQKKPRPYFYRYIAEDIVNWAFVTRQNELFFTHLLLRERRFEFDENSGLPTGETEVFRFCKLQTDGTVLIQFWKTGIRSTNNNSKSDEAKVNDILLEEQVLNLPMIPFTLFDIGNSLLRDVADYQIGLLNLASSDLYYALKSNFPFYTEQYDSKTEDLYRNRGPVTQVIPVVPNQAGPVSIPNNDTVQERGGNAKYTPGINDSQEVTVGTTRGRRYPIGGERPGFIHPSSEPLKASMSKQDQMRTEIRELLNLAVSNVTSTRSSADSKKMDQVGLESGLAAMGLELESGERQLARIWEYYQNSRTNPSHIVYPTTYSLKTDEERMAQATSQKALKVAVPSKTFQKLMAKEIARTLFEGKLENADLEKVSSEVDDANYITSDPLDIQIDMQLGLVTAETASNARGYDGKAEVEKAQKEHADRLATIAMSQAKGGGMGAARGVDTGATDETANTEKDASQKNSDVKSNPADSGTRGKGKKPNG